MSGHLAEALTDDLGEVIGIGMRVLSEFAEDGDAWGSHPQACTAQLLAGCHRRGGGVPVLCH